MSRTPGFDRVVNGAVAAGLGAVLDAGGEPLGEGLARTEQRLAEVADGHGEQLAAFANATLAAGGKRLRPTLVFLSARTMSEDLVSGAVAVELLHMASLVHDDVLDGAALRRGRPTVYAEGGRRAATATGDLLFSRAFGELARTRNPAAIAALSFASSSLARGELMQREDSWSGSVAQDRYLVRCELKTARLFEASCRLGAILGETGEEAAEALGAFGRRIGLAFQILDDVLDVEGPAERTGKARGTDLLDGTVTLPLIIARRRDPWLARAELRAQATDAESAERLCARIAETGALEEARGLALEKVAGARRLLADLELPAESLRALHLVAEGVVRRYA